MIAKRIQAGEMVTWTADADHDGGDVVQMPDGKAAVVPTDCDAGDEIGVYVEGVFEVLKTLTMVMLPGSRFFFDVSAGKAHLLHGGDKDFELGIVYDDVGAASAATTVLVDLNADPEDTLTLEQGFVTVPVSTAGFIHGMGSGEGFNAILDATGEAQKLDALGVYGLVPAGIKYVDALICVNASANAACDISVGLANGTHATDADAITEHLFVHLDGGSVNINLQSKDGTTTVAAADTTVDYTAGTPFLFQADLRNLADIQCYINGVLVLAATVFKLDHAVGPLKLLAHTEKSGTATLNNVSVPRLTARGATL